jgi:hypothetical protein
VLAGGQLFFFFTLVVGRATQRIFHFSSLSQAN